MVNETPQSHFDEIVIEDGAIYETMKNGMANKALKRKVLAEDREFMAWLKTNFPAEVTAGRVHRLGEYTIEGKTLEGGKPVAARTTPDTYRVYVKTG